MNLFFLSILILIDYFGLNLDFTVCLWFDCFLAKKWVLYFAEWSFSLKEVCCFFRIIARAGLQACACFVPLQSAAKTFEIHLLPDLGFFLNFAWIVLLNRFQNLMEHYNLKASYESIFFFKLPLFCWMKTIFCSCLCYFNFDEWQAGLNYLKVFYCGLFLRILRDWQNLVRYNSLFTTMNLQPLKKLQDCYY